MPKCSLTHQKAEQRDFCHAVLSKPYKPVLCAATLERLRTKGYLAADIYHTQAREIRQQLDKLKTERYSSFESKILTMLEDVRKLKSLIDELEQPLEVFDEKLFHEIVTDICINHHDEMTVTQLGGLRFTEQI